MATYIKNDADLRKFVEQISKSMKTPIKRALEEVAEIVKEMWKAHLREYWYDVYNPTQYDRTYETLESIVKTDVVENNGRFLVYIHYDTNLINRYVYAHHDPDAMPYIVEEGDGITAGHPQASHAMERTVEWLEQKRVFENTVREYIKKEMHINVQIM